MPGKRELARTEARNRYAQARRFTDDKLSETSRRSRQANDLAAKVLGSLDFKRLLVEQGVRIIPIVPASKPLAKIEGEQARGLHDCIAFAVTWAFLFPLLKNARIMAYLEDVHPLFVPTLKDAFIFMVMEGPFRQKIRADWLLDNPIYAASADDGQGADD